MSSKEADRIRSMQEKGILTPEQAEELLKALEGDEDVPGALEPPEPPVGASAQPQSESDKEWDDDDWGKRGRRRHRHTFLPEGFLEMGWVDDMVDGITSGLGVRTSPGSPGAGAGNAENYRYDYRYDWGRKGGRWTANGESSSRVEQPEGEGYEFRGNRVVFSRSSGMHLVRSKLRDNSFSASTLKDVDMVDSSMVDCALAGASLHELHMERSELKDVYLGLEGQPDRP